MMAPDTPPAAPKAQYSDSEEDDKFPWDNLVVPANMVDLDWGINKDAAEVRAKIFEAYNSGKPFFTKDALRNIVEAFDRIAAGSKETVAIMGLDGLTVHFRTMTGEVLPVHRRGRSDKFDFVAREPTLGYRVLQHMTATEGFETSFSELTHPNAYLPVAVYHHGDRVNRLTREVMSPLGEPVAHEGLSQMFAVARQKLAASKTCQLLQLLFKGQKAGVKVPSTINKVVAFACGTMAFPTTTLGWKHRLYQNCLAVAIRDLLVDRQGKKGTVACYAQDPGYRAVDKSVLAEAGVTVLADPRGFLEFDEASVVISAWPDVPIRQVVADLARPAVMVWNRIKAQDYDRPMTDPVSPRLLEMAKKEYIEVELPNYERSFDELVIYIRNT